MSESASSVVGLVLGSQDATPLEFWVGVREGGRLQLDDLVVTRTTLDDGDEVTFYGIVDIVRKRFEGSQFDTDAFRVADGTLPADVSYAAHVQVTRVEPEVFVPPSPGAPVDVVRGEEFRTALYFDRMERSVAIGLTRTGEAGPCQPGVPRRHPRRARVHQRCVGRGHQDQLRHVHPLLAVPLGRVGHRRRQRQGAHLQREGRRPAVARQAERQADTGDRARNTPGSACRPDPSRAWRSSRRREAAATRRCPTPAAVRRACSPTSGRCASSAASDCCVSCSSTARTRARRSIW